MSIEKQELIQVVMHPIRQRIAQYLALHKTGTVGEMKQELSDIPPATLYRHIKVLLDAGLIHVIEEKKVRGTIEKTYALVQNPLPQEEVTREDLNLLLQTGLLRLLGTFQTYFMNGDRDPVEDLLCLNTSTLLLSDEEYIELLNKIGALFQEVIYNKPNADRKQRRVTIISSPCEEDGRMTDFGESEKKI